MGGSLLLKHIYIAAPIAWCMSAPSNRRIPLRKRAPERLNAVGHPLEVILLLAGDLVDDVRGRVVVVVRPLDLKRVELEFRVLAVDVLGRVAGEAAHGVDEAHKLLDVVPAGEPLAPCCVERCEESGTYLGMSPAFSDDFEWPL